MAHMTKTPNIRDLDSGEHATLESCHSVIVCLNNRRFVVVRHEEPKDLWPIDGGWQKLRDLQPGDEVIYKGQRTRVRAVDIYR